MILGGPLKLFQHSVGLTKLPFSKRWWLSSPTKLLIAKWAAGLLVMAPIAILSSWFALRYRLLVPQSIFEFELDFALVGIILPLFASALTWAGFRMTLKQFQLLQNKITSFRDFLDKSNRIIEEEHARGREVKIICHSAPIGNLSEQESQEFQTFRGYLMDGNHRITVLCLNDDDLACFYHSYGDRLESSIIEQQLIEAQRIHEVGTKTNGTVIPDHKLKVEKQAYEKLPHFYIVWSERKAIVASVFFLPKFDRSAGARTEKPAGVAENNKCLQKTYQVQINGYVTTDGLEVERCKDAFEYYKAS
ncbi:MAG: hypothetical protein R3F48_08410 [Candidatus Zixiibacteriota bacterium]